MWRRRACGVGCLVDDLPLAAMNLEDYAGFAGPDGLTLI
jgi:hypothetical protein